MSIQNSYFGKLESHSILTKHYYYIHRANLYEVHATVMFLAKRSLLLTMVLQNFETFWLNQWSRKVNLLYALTPFCATSAEVQTASCPRHYAWSVLQRFFLHNKYMSVLKYTSKCQVKQNFNDDEIAVHNDTHRQYNSNDHLLTIVQTVSYN